MIHAARLIGVALTVLPLLVVATAVAGIAIDRYMRNLSEVNVDRATTIWVAVFSTGVATLVITAGL